MDPIGRFKWYIWGDQSDSFCLAYPGFCYPDFVIGRDHGVPREELLPFEQAGLMRFEYLWLHLPLIALEHRCWSAFISAAERILVEKQQPNNLECLEMIWQSYWPIFEADTKYLNFGSVSQKSMDVLKAKFEGIAKQTCLLSGEVAFFVSKQPWTEPVCKDELSPAWWAWPKR